MSRSKRPPESYVDHLAKQLAAKLGCEVRVVRRRELNTMRYGLIMRRGDYDHQFGGVSLKVGELKQWIASLLDMMAMGFLMILPPDATTIEWLAVQRNWQTIRTMLILQGEI